MAVEISVMSITVLAEANVEVTVLSLVVLTDENFVPPDPSRRRNRMIATF